MGFINDQTSTQNFYHDNITPNLTGTFTEDVSNNFVVTGAAGVINDGNSLYFGDALAYGISNNQIQNTLDFTFNENNLLSFDTTGAVTFTSLNVTDSSVFTVVDIDGQDYFTVYSNGAIRMNEATGLPTMNANGLVFYNDDLYASV